MADVDRELSYEIYWTRDGVDKPGSRKLTYQRQGDVSHRPPQDEKMMEGRGRKLEKLERRKNKEAKKAKEASMEVPKPKDKPSLKDLRPEDKQRIANLIRELAKVGEEKEVVVQQLNVERRSYEDKVSKLQQQMEAIVQERELTQKQYLECQKLLAEYQSQLASEQDKLVASLHHQPSPPKFNTSLQSPAKATADRAPTLTHQSFVQSNGFQPRTPNRTRQRPSTQHATQSRPNGYPTAPHQTGYRYPGTHPTAPTGKLIDIHQPGVARNRPSGIQRYPVPNAQPDHPTSPEPKFNPSLASTHRSQPTSNRSWAEPKAAGTGTPAMYVSFGNTGGYVLRPGLDPNQGVNFLQTGAPPGYPTDSQETLASRSQSGEFHPLQPEPETDFESQGSTRPEFATESWNRPNISKPAGNRSQPNAHGDGVSMNTNHPGDYDLFRDAVARQPAYQGIAEQRHSLLEKQRQQLRQEQAWLRQKLRDQEVMLQRKQSQLDQHRLHQLAREQRQDYQMEREWQNYGNSIQQMSNPQANITDLEWEEPNFFNGMHQEAPSGSENDNDDVVSTNFPTNFVNHTPTHHNLENSMRQVKLNQNRYQHSPDVSNTKVAMATGNKNKTQGETINGYASLYPTDRSRPKTQGSTSSHSLSSSNSPTFVDQSTSPLYRDRSTVTTRSSGQGKLSLSPGRIHVTLAPTRTTEVLTRNQPRLTNKRIVSLPQSPRYHSNQASEKKRNVTHLSDLIAQLESPPPDDTTHARPGEATHNTSVPRQGATTTPDCFQDGAYTDTDAEIQESQILEDVFFL